MESEIESLQQKIRGLKEDLAERDGQLKVAKMNLTTAQKQSIHHSQEVSNGGILKLEKSDFPDFIGF